MHADIPADGEHVWGCGCGLMAIIGPGSEMAHNLTSSPVVWGPGLVDDSASKIPCPGRKSADISVGFVSF